MYFHITELKYIHTFKVNERFLNKNLFFIANLTELSSTSWEEVHSHY